MKLAIVGYGMVSPVGMTPLEHAFFPRANLPDPPAVAFASADEERVPVVFCPWLGSRREIPERLEAMALPALRRALLPLVEAGFTKPRIFLGLSRPRPGFSSSARDETVARVLAMVDRASEVVILEGETSVFAAMLAAANHDGPAVFLGLDSFVDPAAVAWLRRHHRPQWESEAVPAGEGAAALAFLPELGGAANKLPTVAVVDLVELASGQATDDNDVAVDGDPLTSLLASALSRPIAFVVGPIDDAPLAAREWQIASARCSERFARGLVIDTIQTATGRLGAAVGAMNLAHAINTLRHDTHEALSSAERFLAFGVDGEGTRAVATATVHRG